MDVDESTDPPHELQQASQLHELLACEQELADLLDEAQAEALRLVDAARAEVGGAAASLEVSLEKEAERERAGIRAETQTRIRALMSAARERSARFDSISEERVLELAESALTRLLSGEASS